jgi:PTH1 family peptidyl-tRNA hydrolase
VLLLVGLGNPGARYAATRHNIGFGVVDALAPAGSWKERFSGYFATLEVGQAKLGLLKPLTFMNESGRSVRAACDFYRILPKDVVVVHDELDIHFGEVRLKVGGGEAGHNGLRSISSHLGTKDYVRLRVGIGKPPSHFKGRGADFVLQAFAAEEVPLLGQVIDRATQAALLMVQSGIAAAMNEVNRKNDNSLLTPSGKP